MLMDQFNGVGYGRGPSAERDKGASCLQIVSKLGIRNHRLPEQRDGGAMVAN